MMIACFKSAASFGSSAAMMLYQVAVNRDMDAVHLYLPLARKTGLPMRKRARHCRSYHGRKWVEETLPNLLRIRIVTRKASDNARSIRPREPYRFAIAARRLSRKREYTRLLDQQPPEVRSVVEWILSEVGMNDDENE